MPKICQFCHRTKITFCLTIATVMLAMPAIAQSQSAYPAPQKIARKWMKYNPGEVIFSDKAPDTRGAQIYHAIVPNPQEYIGENALRVLQTLYDGPKDKNIPRLDKIYYSLENYDGVSEKYGHGDHVGIRYSTRWIEHSFGQGDTARVDYESRGVLYHELTHAYQLEPQGCGEYGDGGEYWCFIEGMADAVRVACGCFSSDFASTDRPRQGTWRNGYRVAGYFLYWLYLNKDRQFLRKFNRSAVELNPWSWDSAMHHILGKGVEELWKEYKTSLGEKP